MKAIFVADLHSDREQYSELKERICANQIELLIIGGDLLEYATEMNKQIEFIEAFLCDFFETIKIPKFVINGNVEWLGAVKYYEQLAEGHKISMLTMNPIGLEPLELVGYPYSNPSPFSRKDYEKRDLNDEIYRTDKPIFISNERGILIEKDLEYFNQLPSIEEDIAHLKHKGIWVMHAPPYGTKLDVIKSGEHVGSQAIRHRIEQVQPLLTLHGHIHESPYVTNGWLDHIGNTICINPGRGESLHAVILHFLDNGSLVSAEHTVFGKVVF